MPSFTDAITVDSPPEEVFKLVHDPTRMPEWMAGVGHVEDVATDDDGTGFTLYPEGWPDFPMAQRLTSSPDGRRVTVSCHVSFLEIAIALEEADDDRTHVTIEVDIPPEEAARLKDQRAAVRATLERLAQVAPTARGRGGDGDA
ncbi:MAG: SRPBCC family protein [Solirubrobacteraceae bacterium]|nr:SRPBCC family protein [Solirubrobacteraceae bacterium]